MKRAKKYHPNHPHIDGRNVVIGSDYDALAAKAERYIQEGISLADQRDALAADNQRLREDRDSHQRACMAQIEKAARLLEALESARNALYQACGLACEPDVRRSLEKAVSKADAALAGSKGGE